MIPTANGGKIRITGIEDNCDFKKANFLTALQKDVQ